MDKAIELAREAFDCGFTSLPAQQWRFEKFYTLARADLEAENAKLKEHLRWALSNINCEPYEWSDEENADAHEAARAALGETND